MKRHWKRTLSVLLSVAMLFSMTGMNTAYAVERGTPTGAAGLCERHPAHTDACGYAGGIRGTPCGHEHSDECCKEVTECVHKHTDDCYDVEADIASDSNAKEPVDCSHICDEESGCMTQVLDCFHEHNEDCGYIADAPGTPCAFVCEECAEKDQVNGSEDGGLTLGDSGGLDALTGTVVIAAFDALSDDVRHQDYLPGEITLESELNLPNDLTGTDDGGAQITIEGVIWQSDWAFDPETTGAYFFSPVLPEGYSLAEGVTAPRIFVTIEWDEAGSNANIVAALYAYNESHTENGGKGRFTLAGGIEGTVTGATETLALEIPSNVKVKWQADFSGALSGAPMVRLTGDGMFEVSGYCIFGRGSELGDVIEVGDNVTFGITGVGVVVAWDGADSGNYPEGSTTDLTAWSEDDAVTVQWAIKDGESGIRYTKGIFNAFVAVDGVTVIADSPGGPETIVYPGAALRDDPLDSSKYQSLFPISATSGNSITVNSGGDTIGGAVYGGFDHPGHNGSTGGLDVTGNTVTINGGEITGSSYTAISGGRAYDGDASNNTVIINGGTITGFQTLRGGESMLGDTKDNHIIITGGTIEAQIESGIGMGTTENNSISIREGGVLDLSKSSFMGGYIGKESVLNVERAGVAVMGIRFFDYYNFKLPSTISNGGVMLTAKFGDGTFGGTSADIGGATIGITFAGTPTLALDDKITLIDSTVEGMTGTPANSTASASGYTFGIAVEGGKLIAAVTGVPGGGQTTHPISVTNGTANPTSAVPGATVNLTAGAAPVGQRFKEWTITPSVTFADGTGKNSATAKFTMPAENVSATAVYENIPADTTTVTGASLDTTNLLLYSNTKPNTATLTATVFPSDATNKTVTWASGNTSVAAVDQNGNVTAVGNGTAVITVTTTDGGYTASCTVKVMTYNRGGTGGGSSGGTSSQPAGTTAQDPKKGNVNSLTGIITGSGAGYSNWQPETVADGTVRWKLQYADGTTAAGTIVTREDGSTYEHPAWEMVNGAWYPFGADCYVRSGMIYDPALGGYFYIDINTGMKTGWQLIDGKWYYFNPVSDGSRGILFADAWIDGWYVDKNGIWNGAV